MAAPGPDLLNPCNDEDAYTRSGTRFLSLAGCSHLFGVHDPCGNHSIWYCLFLLGLASSEMAILEIVHVALRVGPMTLRLSGGVNFRGEYRCCSLG